VHLRPHRAGEAEIEYDEKHTSPSIDVKLALCDADLETLASTHPALHDRSVSAVIWTTTPWTLPANLAVAFHPEADYALYPVEGSSEVLIIAKALREAALARWKERPLTLGEPLAEMKGSTFEGLRFRHPWIDRDSVGVLGDYVTLDTGTGVVHTAPGHGWDDYLTGVKYGLEIYCPVDEAGRFLPEVEFFAGQKVFDANPKVIDSCAKGRARIGQGDALLPHLLAVQEPDHLPRDLPVVHRPRHRRLPRARARRHRQGPLVPGLGRGAHPQHDRVPARLVHLAPAPVGRAHSRLLLQGLLVSAAHARDRAPRRRPVRGGQRRRLVGP
jgi:hypothetical protein